jgi:NAD(P)H dehydrogenase (quinone)
MADNGSILVTGAAGQLGAVGRTERELKKKGLPEHLTLHLLTMAGLHRAGRYDRLADGVERVTGRPAMSVREFVSLHADQFGGRRS